MAIETRDSLLAKGAERVKAASEAAHGPEPKAASTKQKLGPTEAFLLGRVRGATQACRILALRIQSGKAVSSEAIQACSTITGYVSTLVLDANE